MGIDSDEKMESIAMYSGKSRQQLYDEWKPAVTKAIAGRLLLDKLVEKSGLEITEDDLNAEYAKQAEGSAMSAEEVKAEYEKRQSVEYLKERMKETRFFDGVLAAAKLSQGEKKSFVDFMSAAE
jgi:trigger factor